MSPERFKEILAEVQTATVSVLASKAKEYSRDGERFHNFIRAGRRMDIDPIFALMAMKEKHSVSISDMVADAMNGVLPSRTMLDEKFIDEINYLIIAYAMFRERIDAGGES